MDIASKYNFSYDEYNKGMDIFERAQRVGRFDELIEKRAEFDWTDVPQFKSAK